MLTQLRNPYVMRWGMWVILGLTIPAFVAFYGFSGQPSSHLEDTWLLKVKSPAGELHELKGNDLIMAKNEAAAYYANVAVSAGVIPPGQAPAIQNEVRNALGNDEVADFAAAQIAVRDEMETQKIRVSDAQVGQYLRDQGMTSEDLKGILKSRRITEAEFIQEVRARLLDQQGDAAISRIARTSLLEVWQEYLLANEKIDASIVRFPVRPDNAAAVDEAEAKKRYDELVAKKDPIIIDGAKRVYEYVVLEVPQSVPEPPSNDAVYKEYLAIPDNDPEFFTPGGTEVRQVLAATWPAMAAADRDAARERAAKARQRIEAGEAFENVANEMSDDPRNLSYNDAFTSPTLRGGRLPYRFDGTESAAWGEAWASFVKSAEPAKVSDVIETPQGFAVVRVDGRVPPGKMPFEEASKKVTERLSKKMADEAEKVRQEKIAANLRRITEAAKQETKLAGIARALGVDVKETSPTLSVSTYIVGIGNLQRERTSLVALEKGMTSPVLQTETGASAVLHVKEEIPEKNKEFAAVRVQIEGQIRRERAVAEAEKKAAELIAGLKEGDNLTSAALALSYDAKSPAPFKRSEAPQELRSVQELDKKLLAIKAGDTLTMKAGPPTFTTEVVVLRANAVIQPEKKAFFDEMTEFEGRMLAAKRQGFVEDFRRDAARTLKMEKNPIFFGEQK